MPGGWARGVPFLWAESAPCALVGGWARPVPRAVRRLQVAGHRLNPLLAVASASLAAAGAPGPRVSGPSPPHCTACPHSATRSRGWQPTWRLPTAVPSLKRPFWESGLLTLASCSSSWVCSPHPSVLGAALLHFITILASARPACPTEASRSGHKPLPCTYLDFLTRPLDYRSLLPTPGLLCDLLTPNSWALLDEALTFSWFFSKFIITDLITAPDKCQEGRWGWSMEGPLPSFSIALCWLDSHQKNG